MRVGVDFPDYFAQDTYAVRRGSSGGGSGAFNGYNPESLITGKELSEGLTYENSSRIYESHEQYLKIVSGEISTNDVPTLAPRTLK